MLGVGACRHLGAISQRGDIEVIKEHRRLALQQLQALYRDVAQLFIGLFRGTCTDKMPPRAIIAGDNDAANC